MIGYRIANKISAGTAQLVSHGRIKIKNPETELFLKCVCGFAFGFFCAAGKLFDDRSPFGLGLCALCPINLPGILTLSGILAGYLVSGGFVWAVKYIAILVLIVGMTATFRKSEIREKEWFAPLTAGAMTAGVNFVYLAEIGITGGNIILLFIESLIASAGAWSMGYVFAMPESGFARESSASARKMVAILFLLSSILVTLSRVSFINFIALGRILAAAVIMLAAFDGRIAYGCPTAITIGVFIDAAANSSPYFTVIYGAAALVSGVFARHGKYLYAASFVFVASGAAVWSSLDVKSAGAVCEAIIGAGIFLLLPQGFVSSVGAMLGTYGQGGGTEKASEYTRRKIEQTAAAFRELYETVKTASGEGENTEEIATVFDRAADKVCRKCPYSVKCWQINYQYTLNVFNDISAVMTKKGEVCEEDFPKHFSESCSHTKELAEHITSEVRALLYKRSYRKRLLERQGAAYSQYFDIASVLKGLSAELEASAKREELAEERLFKYLKSIDIDPNVSVFRDRGGRMHAEIRSPNLFRLRQYKDYLDRLSYVLETRLCTAEMRNTSEKIELLEAEPLTAAVGIAAAKKAGQSISGDRGIYFKTDEGFLYVILSDGMGTGEKAAECSGSAVRILERFLRAGVSPETAVRILNGLMLLKNETDTAAATVDLLCVSLFTGEAKIFKYGAAPSYIRKGENITRISSRSFASGIGADPSAGPDVTKLKLSPRSVAVITSDGIQSGSDDTWIRNYIEEYEGESPKELARNIVKSACNKFGCDDDMTVLTVFVEPRT